MKIHRLLKWSLIASLIATGAFFFILAAIFVWMLVYVVHKQHAYAVMQDTHNLNNQIQKMGVHYLAGHKNGALVIAFYQRGQESVQGFGVIGNSNSGTPDARTIFEIGSVTKIFTATLLAEMFDDGAANPNDPISRYLPKGVTSPAFNGHEITLVDLATHNSGLPRLPGNIGGTVKDQGNPYANYNTADLYDSLRMVKLTREPGKRSVYSNYGYGLLGKILELKIGKSYEELLQADICKPLQLDSTTTQLSKEQVVRLTPGHSSDGAVVPNWTFDALAGCGAIRSDAADLLKLLEAELGPADSGISRALKTTQTCYFKGLAEKIGLGWQIDESIEGPTFYWHNGETGGYRSFVAFDRDHHTAVVVLSNRADGLMGLLWNSPVDDMGMRLLTIGSKVSLH